MTPRSISRKNFIKNSSVLLAGAGLLATGSAGATNDKPVTTVGKTLLLKNVRLETGFEYEEGEVVHTKTDLFLVEIAEGKIKAVLPNKPDAKAIDARGALMLPAFKDMHIHLDKTFYGLPWKAHLKKTGR